MSFTGKDASSFQKNVDSGAGLRRPRISDPDGSLFQTGVASGE